MRTQVGNDVGKDLIRLFGNCARSGAVRADAKLAGASPYLRMLATTLGGFLLARSARAARRSGHPLAASKLASARFYIGQLLPPAAALRAAVTAGSAPLRAALD